MLAFVRSSEATPHSAGKHDVAATVREYFCHSFNKLSGIHIRERHVSHTREIGETRSKVAKLVNHNIIVAEDTLSIFNWAHNRSWV